MERSGVVRGAREAGILALAYGAYSLVRNLMGDDRGVALLNARRLIGWEESLGLFHERSIQMALDNPLIIRPINTFYALAHFFVTGGLMIWLYHRRRLTPVGNRYARWRNAILATCGIALLGYAAFPLMPPRLTPGDGVIDALEVWGAPWTYQGEAATSLSNQFAAMPSLHVAWAIWCSLVLWHEGPGIGRSAQGPWRVVIRTVAVLYTTAACVAVVATGNHYVLDAVGGALVVTVGAVITRNTGREARRRWRRVGGQLAVDDAVDAQLDDVPPTPIAPDDLDVPAVRRDSEAVVAAVDGDDVTRVVAARSTGQVHR